MVNVSTFNTRASKAQQTAEFLFNKTGHHAYQNSRDDIIIKDTLSIIAHCMHWILFLRSVPSNGPPFYTMDENPYNNGI